MQCLPRNTAWPVPGPGHHPVGLEVRGQVGTPGEVKQASCQRALDLMPAGFDFIQRATGSC